jgi:mono/diheme cytochrome c family protein
MPRWTTALSGRWIVTVVTILGVVGSLVAYDRLWREHAAPYFESDEEHFLYGSVGAESRDGIPYWIWLVLPRVFPDLLPGPGGYTTLGLLTRSARDLPIGLSQVTIGYPRVAMNCAFCHTGSVRAQPRDLPTIVPGAPAHQVAAQRYVRFLVDAASDPRFTAGNLLGEIARNYRLSTIDRLLYRFVVIPGTRRQLLRMKDQHAWMGSRPEWGHGRMDVFNPLRFQRLERPADDAVGTADTMALWGAGARESQGLFWNGLQRSLRDAVALSALAAGASRPWLDADIAKWDRADGPGMSSLQRVYRYIADLKAPPYPFAIDRGLAAAGQSIYASACAQCHAAGTTPATSPAGDAGTDRSRLRAWTSDASVAYEGFASRRAWKGAGMVSSEGYVPVALDGVWIRAPYLHNGSVPSLADLLEASDRRPTQFWRGYDVYDPVRVGFVSEGQEARRVGTRHDASQPGNSNVGHDYGTALPLESKRALLEYLKTL